VFRNKLEQYVPEELNKLFQPTTEEEIKIGEAGMSPPGGFWQVNKDRRIRQHSAECQLPTS
jgi:hypothetical protein